MKKKKQVYTVLHTLNTKPVAEYITSGSPCNVFDSGLYVGCVWGKELHLPDNLSNIIYVNIYNEIEMELLTMKYKRALLARQ